MSDQAVSDESLTRALSLYAGMVDHVLGDPGRWLGLDQPGSAKLPGKALHVVRRAAFGRTNPASKRWAKLSLKKRVRWWVRRINLTAGLAAAAPRFAGALASRLPLQAALGASAAGLAVCAAAREAGTIEPDGWVPLLAKVLLGRDLDPEPAALVTSTTAAQQLDTPPEDAGQVPAVKGSRARQAAATLWRFAHTFTGVQHLLDARPRGSLFARGVALLPVVGVAGGWLDERAGIRKAARQTLRLLRTTKQAKRA